MQSLAWLVIMEGRCAVKAQPVASAFPGKHDDTIHGTLSAGSVLLIIVFSVLIIYFIGGIVIRKFIGGATGYEIIPNYDFWSDIPLLIKDGALYTFSGCRPEVVYERI